MTMKNIQDLTWPYTKRDLTAIIDTCPECDRERFGGIKRGLGIIPIRNPLEFISFDIKGWIITHSQVHF
jgi:hypothetical protein